jgi:hypothetical protein
VSKFRTTNIWRTRSEVHFTNDRPVFVCEETGLKISLARKDQARERKRERDVVLKESATMCRISSREKNQTKPRAAMSKSKRRWIEMEERRGEEEDSLSPAGARFPCFYNYTMQASAAAKYF